MTGHYIEVAPTSAPGGRRAMFRDCSVTDLDSANLKNYQNILFLTSKKRIKEFVRYTHRVTPKGKVRIRNNAIQLSNIMAKLEEKEDVVLAAFHQFDGILDDMDLTAEERELIYNVKFSQFLTGVGKRAIRDAFPRAARQAQESVLRMHTETVQIADAGGVLITIEDDDGEAIPAFIIANDGTIGDIAGIWLHWIIRAKDIAKKKGVTVDAPTLRGVFFDLIMQMVGASYEMERGHTPVTLGADPEFLMYGERQVHPGRKPMAVTRWFDGRERASAYYYGKHVGHDGHAPTGELRPLHAESSEEIVKNIEECLIGVAALAPKGSRIIAGGGCLEPTGGHIHFGHPALKRGGSGLHNIITRVLDAWLYKPLAKGTPFMQRGWGNYSYFRLSFAQAVTQWRKMSYRDKQDSGEYGGGGGHRRKPHGFEYRSLPSFIVSRELTSIVFKIGQAIVQKIVDAQDRNEVVKFKRYPKEADYKTILSDSEWEEWRGWIEGRPDKARLVVRDVIKNWGLDEHPDVIASKHSQASVIKWDIPIPEALCMAGLMEEKSRYKTKEVQKYVTVPQIPDAMVTYLQGASEKAERRFGRCTTRIGVETVFTGVHHAAVQVTAEAISLNGVRVAARPKDMSALLGSSYHSYPREGNSLPYQDLTRPYATLMTEGIGWWVFSFDPLKDRAVDGLARYRSGWSQGQTAAMNVFVPVELKKDNGTAILRTRESSAKEDKDTLLIAMADFIDHYYEAFEGPSDDSVEPFVAEETQKYISEKYNINIKYGR